MATWNEVLEEINSGSNYDLIRRKYLKRLSAYTGRNTIAYYSGWLQKQNFPFDTMINDSDKNGLMAAVNKLKPSKGLDLIIHTPGGDTAATESIVDYLKSKFENIRVIVPQLALSAGTMIACASNEIVMGKHSSLGPVDPQIQGMPAHGIIEEFSKAYDDIKKDQIKIAVWQPILAKYPPSFVGECQKAIDWSNQLLKNFLSDRMLSNLKEPQKSQAIEKIAKELGDHSISYAHNRHLSAKKCKEIGLTVTFLEDDQKLQDLVLSVHHAFIHTLTATPTLKIIENNLTTAFIQGLQPVMLLPQNERR